MFRCNYFLFRLSDLGGGVGFRCHVNTNSTTPTARSPVLVGWQWGADVYAAIDEAFQNRFVPFWHKAFYLSALGLEVPAAVPKLFFGG